MSSLQYFVSVVALVCLAMISLFTKCRWEKSDRDARIAFDQEEADRQYRHQEPSWFGPKPHMHLGAVRLVYGLSTIGYLVLVGARIMGWL
jgi:hypothetical protein